MQQAEDINPFNLPSLPLANHKQLPKQPGIYFVLKGQTVLYIGGSRNIQQRLSYGHHRWHQFKALEVDVAWLKCSDIKLLKKIEKALIAYFQPSLNWTKVFVKESGGLLYDEPKIKIHFALTPTAIARLEAKAVEQGISRSEVVERFARNLELQLQGGTSDGQ